MGNFLPANRIITVTIGETELFKEGDFLSTCLRHLFIPVCLGVFLLTECSLAPRYTRSPQHKNHSKRTDQRGSKSFKGTTLYDGSYQKIGFASYYGSKFDGRKTASGEIFRNTLFTAAHPKLPFGTNVKVTCLENNRSVIVRINDRGPFSSKKRIIDISQSAARELGIIKKGVAKVSIEIVE